MVPQILHPHDPLLQPTLPKGAAPQRKILSVTNRSTPESLPPEPITAETSETSETTEPTQVSVLYCKAKAQKDQKLSQASEPKAPAVI